MQITITDNSETITITLNAEQVAALDVSVDEYNRANAPVGIPAVTPIAYVLKRLADQLGVLAEMQRTRMTQDLLSKFEAATPEQKAAALAAINAQIP